MDGVQETCAIKLSDHQLYDLSKAKGYHPHRQVIVCLLLKPKERMATTCQSAMQHRFSLASKRNYTTPIHTRYDLSDYESEVVV